MVDNTNGNLKTISETNQEIDFSNFISEFIRPIFRRKNIFLFSSATFILIGVFFTIKNRIKNPVFVGNFTLLVSDPLRITNERGQNDSEIFQNLAINNSTNNIPTLIEFLRSSLALEPLAKKYNLTTNNLKSRIEITNRIGLKTRVMHSYNDGVLLISLFSKNPKKDIVLLEDLSKHYLQLSTSQRQKRLQEGLNFLNEQEPKLQEKTIKLQSELVIFRKKNSLIEPLIEGNTLKERQSKIEEELLKLIIDQKKLESVKKGITSGTLSTRGFKEAISVASNNGGLIISDFDKSLVEELLIVESELAKALSKFKESSVIVKALKNRINAIKPLFVEKQLKTTDTAQKLNNEKMVNLKEQLSEIEDSFQQQPNLIKKYNTLKQNLEIAQKNLLGLVAARESFQLKIAQSRVPWQIIEPARMGNKIVRPRTKRTLAVTFFTSLLGGAVIAFIRDKLDNHFHDRNEIKSFTNLPILGSFPFLGFFSKESEKIGVKNESSYLDFFSESSDEINNEKNEKNYTLQKFVSQESLRSIYSSIRFLNADNEIKTICITSSIPGEGKSLINIFLSKIVSEMDKKVLLIDTDLRRPQIHKRLKLNNLKGLSNYLTSPKSENYKNYIQDIKNIPNLKVLTAGICPPNSAKLLNSQRMENFINELKNDQDYEYIFFDTPPLLGLADTLLLGNKIDSFFLIISINNISKSVVKTCIQKSELSGTKIQGLITNVLNLNQKQFITNNIYGENYYGDNYYGNNYYNRYYSNSKFDDSTEKENLKSSSENKDDLQISLKQKIINLWKEFIIWIDK